MFLEDMGILERKKTFLHSLKHCCEFKLFSSFQVHPFNSFLVFSHMFFIFSPMDFVCVCVCVYCHLLSSAFIPIFLSMQLSYYISHFLSYSHCLLAKLCLKKKKSPPLFPLYFYILFPLKLSSVLALVLSLAYNVHERIK